MPGMKQGGALQTIFSFFLGLMVTAFVGVGVYTFHPSPQDNLFRQVQSLDRQEQAVRNSRPPEALTPADRDRIQELNTERDALSDTARVTREAWGRSTSIILLVFATLAMAVSLIGADRLPVINNGLLLGGVFTMLYGVGWISMTGTSIGRFVVMTLALGITFGLGYIRFVRRAGPIETHAPRGGDVGGLERRVRDLEARMNDAASALGRRDGR